MNAATANLQTRKKPTTSQISVLRQPHSNLLQRKCACGGTPGPSGECEECRKNRLNVQRRDAHETESAIVDRALHALPASTSRPAYSFATVPVHARSPLSIQTKLAVNQPGDPYEQEADRASEYVMRAEARAASDRNEPPRLSAAGPRVQRQEADEAPAGPIETTEPPAAAPETVPEPASPAETPTAGLLVEDEATELSPGQIRKSEFLDELRAAVCAAADAELAAVGRSTEDCPYIEYWIGYYGTRSSDHIERAIRKYAPETAGVTTAEDYIPLITERVRQGVATWATTGQITGLPEELASLAPGGGGMLAGAASAASGVVSGMGGLLFKARNGGPRDADPQEIRSQLRSGSPLDGGVKARMESAFGHDFSRVRVHTDGQAANLSSSLNARAFTIGRDIAFGAGEYQPGTMIGDAILAHELAHVAQQGEANSSTGPMPSGGSLQDALEEDADTSAVGAVFSLWSGMKKSLTDVARNAMPRLKTGLKLQRCKGGKEEEKKKEKPLEASKITDAAIEATAEYKAYMDPALQWQTKYKMTRDEALLAYRLIVRAKAEGTKVTFSADAETYMNLARKQLGTAKQAESLKGNLTWVQVTGANVAGQTPWESDFGKWLVAGGPEPDTTTGKCNCWEMVMFSAYKGGYTSKQRIEDLYNEGIRRDKDNTRIFPATLEKELRRGNEYVLKPNDPDSPEPLPGDIVIFTQAANHVAISLGTKDSSGRHKVISHWPPPDGSYKVKETTIEELLAKMQGGNVVKFWSPAW